MLFKQIDVCMLRIQCRHNHILINSHYFVIITSVPFLVMFGICIVITLRRGNTFVAYTPLVGESWISQQLMVFGKNLISIDCTIELDHKNFWSYMKKGLLEQLFSCCNHSQHFLFG